MLTLERFSYLAEAVRRHFPFATSSSRVIDSHTGMTVADLHGMVETVEAAKAVGDPAPAPTTVVDAPAALPGLADGVTHTVTLAIGAHDQGTFLQIVGTKESLMAIADGLADQDLPTELHELADMI